MPGIAEDRISDLTASVIKRWLAEFTQRHCQQWGIPTTRRRLIGWDPAALDWRPFDAYLPYNPSDASPVLLAPLNLLRRLPWLNYGDYYRTAYAPLVLPPGRAGRAVAKQDVLAYNRAHFDTVRGYLPLLTCQVHLRGQAAPRPTERVIVRFDRDPARRFDLQIPLLRAPAAC